MLKVPAAQASQPRIAIVISDDALAQDGLMARSRRRLRSELHAAGFQVVEITTEEGSGRDTVERGARQADAVAAARLLRAEGTTSVDVWISDQLTEKTVVRRIPMTADDPQAPATMALRVVELLKASLVEIELDLQTQSQTEAPPEVDRLIEDAKGNEASDMPWSISVGATTLWSPGQVPSVGPRVRLAHRFSNGLAVGVHFAGPLWGPDLATSAGDIRRLEMTLLGVLRLYREVGHSRWSWSPGIALGAYTIGVDGNAERGFVERSERAWTAMAAVSLGIVRKLGSRFELELDGFVGGLLPQVSVRVGTVREGRFGAPLVGGTLSFATAF